MTKVDQEQERLYSGDKVLFNKKYYVVIRSYYKDEEGLQVVSMMRVADAESNRKKDLTTIRARACNCRIIYESKNKYAIRDREEENAKQKDM